MTNKEAVIGEICFFVVAVAGELMDGVDKLTMVV